MARTIAKSDRANGGSMRPYTMNRRALLAVVPSAAMIGIRRLKAQEKTLQIGFPLELSGRFSSYGAPGKRGAEMAMEAFDYRAAGLKIEPLFRDIQSETQTTISALTELVVSRGLNYVVGPIASPTVAAAIPIIRQQRPIWLVPGSSSTTLEESIGSEGFFFHTWPYAYNFHSSEALALRAYLGEKSKKVAVIYSDDGYGRTHLPYVEKFYPQQGFEIVAKELVRANSSDLNPVLTRLNRLGADILIGLVQTNDAVTLAKQIQTRRMTIPYLVGTSYTQLREWQSSVGEAQEGWVGVTSYLPGMERAASATYPKIFPKLSDWAARFRARFNIEADFLDVLNYATVALLLIAVDKAGVDDKSKVAEELRKIDMSTINGPAKFSPSLGGTQQQAFTDMVVFQRQKGQNILLYPKDVENGTLLARG